MTTASTSTPVSMASNATFQSWYNEQITQLTAVGLTQTADTGQISPTAVIPAVNTSAGYTTWRFNDTLQSTAAIFIKLEFGVGAILTEPQMWITVGTGSNGSGTLTGTTTTRVACLTGSPPQSTVTNYASRWCYNATDGYLGMVFKTGSLASSVNVSMGAFFIFRGNTTGGASAGDAYILVTNSINATGTSASAGVMQCYSYASAAVFPALAVATAGGWVAGPSAGLMPFALTTTLVGGVTAYITPVYYMNPNICFSAFLGVALLSEAPLGTTISLAIIGATTHTFLSVGAPFGTNGSFGLAQNIACTLLMIWE